MTRKTASLAYPADPLASIRELQELNASPDTGGSGTSDRFSAHGPPHGTATAVPAPVRLATANAGYPWRGSERWR